MSRTKIILMIVLGMLVLIALLLGVRSPRGIVALWELSDTRRTLHEQGFKTDITEFNITTGPATRARAAALMYFYNPLQLDDRTTYLNLMPMVSNGTAIVIWRQDYLTNYNDVLRWPLLDELLTRHRGVLDAACDAAMSGPIIIDIENGREIGGWTYHSSTLENLAEVLSVRVMVELHNGNPDPAWTSLLAATRLASAWEPEPSEYVASARCFMADIAFNDTWQMLQTNCWPDEKLAILQHEWESTNFLAILPETMAFARAIFVYDCQLRNQQNPFAVRSLLAIAGEAINDPASAHRDITNGLDIMRYHGTAAWTDEKNLLLHFRDRELELRHAIQSPTWAEMHKQPGVTNSIPFKPEYVGLMEYINNSEIERPLLLMQAAASEAERRILITAIALERYRGKHGSYPNSLALLSQEFLKAVPVNYMDGQPLRYRPTADGHFVLYSVGLDCVDDGGKPPAPGGPRLIINNNGNFAILTNQDIVWPVPASP